MSHIVEIRTEVRDPLAIAAACDRLQLPAPAAGQHRLYSDSVTGLAVQLPDWRYPVVCDTATGQVRYDNYGGRWGDQSRLNQFLQAYAVEKARLEARRRGHSVTEQSLSDGSIKLTIRVGA
jgi:hypothetical protein